MKLSLWIAALSWVLFALLTMTGGVFVAAQARNAFEREIMARLERAHTERVENLRRIAEAGLRRDDRAARASRTGELTPTAFAEVQRLVLLSGFGRRGRVFIVDKQGDAVVSSEAAGENLLDRRDATGSLYIRDIVNKEQGRKIVPMSAGLDGEQTVEELFFFDPIPELDWILVSACSLDAEMAPVARLERRIYWTLGIVIALALPLLLALGWQTTRPLGDLVSQLRRAVEENDPSPVAVTTRDEAGAIARLSNRLFERMRSLRDEASRDIAEREEADRAIDKQRRFLRQVIDTDPNFIYAKDRDGRYTLVNRAVAQAYGMTPDEMVGLTDEELEAAVEGVRHFRGEDTLVIETSEERFIQEERFVDANGRERWLQTILRPILDAQGLPSQALGVSADITKRRQAEQELMGARDELEKRVAERTADLQSANDELQREVAERNRVKDELQTVNQRLSASVRELEQRAYEISLLNQMGDLLQACRDVEETYSVFRQIAEQLFPDERGALCMYSPAQKVVEAVVTWGDGAPVEPMFVMDDCWALRRGKTHQVAGGQTANVCRHLTKPAKHGYVCAPLIAQGEVLGLLHLQWGAPPDLSEALRQSLFESKQRLASTVGEQFALALANLKLSEELRVQSIRDALTGLFNRRYMEESLEREIKRAERRKKPMGVIMFDIDHFKKFNDNYGHEAGDDLLREMGAMIADHVRKEDIPCRYGGEEFLVIMPESSLANTRKRAEQFRELVKERLTPERVDKIKKSVTISMGVSAYPKHGLSGEAAVAAADKALYEAKRGGRDQVRVAVDDDEA